MAYGTHARTTTNQWAKAPPGKNIKTGDEISFEARPAELDGRTVSSTSSTPKAIHDSTDIGQIWLTWPLLDDIACLERLERPNRATKMYLDAIGGSPGPVPGTSDMCMPLVRGVAGRSGVPGVATPATPAHRCVRPCGSCRSSKPSMAYTSPPEKNISNPSANTARGTH